MWEQAIKSSHKPLCQEVHVFADLVKYIYFRDFQHTWLSEDKGMTAACVHLGVWVELSSKQFFGHNAVLGVCICLSFFSSILGVGAI